MIEIELMSEEHLMKIAKIEESTFSEPWSERALRVELHNDKAYFIVAKIEEKIVGYMGVYNVCSEGYITNIAVLKEYRGKAVGSALMTNTINFAIETNIDFLTLEVRKSNNAAIKFYKKFKFKEEGIRKNFYRHPNEDAFIMTRRF